MHLILYGSWSPHLLASPDISRLEFHLILPLIFATLFLGIAPAVLLGTI